MIEARPQSGYYVRRAPDPPPAPARTATNERAAELTDQRSRPARDPRLAVAAACSPTSASPRRRPVIHASRLDRLLGALDPTRPATSSLYDSPTASRRCASRSRGARSRWA